MTAQENYPKFVQIIENQSGLLMALDAEGVIWFFEPARELHTGERITAHWSPIITMERRP